MDILRKRPPKEKRPPGRDPKWTNEYMFMVVKKVLEEGMTYREAAKTFNVSSGAVGAWIRKHKKGVLGTNPKNSEASDEIKIFRLEEQVQELKGEIGDLYLQNQLLKKALYHSQQKKKDNSSVITSENLAQFQKGAK
ncbi:MAG: transposase [Proteobacteria bacterium]|nr:transposase [Pseudomonadota bacterium]